MNGLLVSIEGPKSVGKTTLVKQLKLALETTDWLFTKEPTEKFDLGIEERFVGIRLAELIAEDRALHLQDVIEPALRAGRVVVRDRYTLSSFVFHCLDGVAASDIAALNDRFPRPDVLVLLQCSPTSLKSRRRAHAPTPPVEHDPVI
jgi:dTMP kinase